MKKSFLVTSLLMIVSLQYIFAEDEVAEESSVLSEETAQTEQTAQRVAQKNDDEEFLRQIENDKEDFSIYRFVESPFNGFRNWDSLSKSCLHDNYLGIPYVEVPMRKLVCQSMGVAMYASSGSFSIYVRNEKKHKIPLLSSADGGKNSAMYLRIDETAYRLNSSNAFKKTVRRTKDSAQLCFSKRNSAQVVVDFRFEKTGIKRAEDAVVIDVRITNTSAKIHTYDFRTILDTALGENIDFPFKSGLGRPVSKEFIFWGRSIDAEKFLECSDGRTSIQIPFYGKNLTKMESVSVSSLSVLEGMGWGIESAKSRGFNDYNSSMNPAVMLDWTEFDLEPGKTQKITFCIVTGTDGYTPRAQFYTDGFVPEDARSAPARDKPSVV